MRNVNGDDDAAEVTSHVDNNRTGVSNNSDEHSPLRQEESNDEPLVDTEILNQGRTRIPCLYIIFPLILLIFIGYYFFLEISHQGKSFHLGPYDSILIDESPNPWFTEYMQVVRVHEDTRDPIIELFEPDTAPKNIRNNWSTNPMFFAFEKTPSLNILSYRKENHNSTLHGQGAEVDYVYYLNKGSKIEVSYNVTSLVPPHVYLVVREEFSSPNDNLLGIAINGTGEVGQEIPKSAKYHLIVYNMRIDSVKVELQLNIKGVAYDQSEAFFKCRIDEGKCFLRIPFKGANIGLLAVPDPNVGNGDDVDKAYIIVSYEQRWMTWMFLLGGLIAISVTTEFVTRSTSIEGSIPLRNMSRQRPEGWRSSEDNPDGYIPLEEEGVNVIN